MDDDKSLDDLPAEHALGVDPAIPAARPGRSASSTWRWPATPARVHSAVPIDDAGTSLESELETLADILPFLVSRHDEPPAGWLAPAFGRQIAFVRSRVTTIANNRHLAARLGPDATGLEGRFERATRRLATDATAVALAIRWLEIEADTRFPSWSEILRRRTLHPAPVERAGADASFWFG